MPQPVAREANSSHRALLCVVPTSQPFMNHQSGLTLISHPRLLNHEGAGVTRATGWNAPLAKSCPHPPYSGLHLGFTALLPLLAPGHKSNFTVTAFVKAGGSLGERGLLP